MPLIKITLTDSNGTYSVERETGETLRDYFEDVVIPVLNAAGFSPTQIEDYLGE